MIWLSFVRFIKKYVDSNENLSEYQKMDIALRIRDSYLRFLGLIFIALCLIMGFLLATRFFFYLLTSPVN